MNVLIVGAKGNIGSRYSCIVRHLAHTPIEIDIPHSESTFQQAVGLCDHVIVATPTEFHVESVLKVIKHARPGTEILCEKPIAKKLNIVAELYQRAYHAGCNLYSVNQYNYLSEAEVFENETGPTRYNYFKSGKDGLYFDCFQLFALASGKVSLANSSPIWSCAINGVPISIKGMDLAYLQMIEDFLGAKAKLWGESVVLPALARILEELDEVN